MYCSINILEENNHMVKGTTRKILFSQSRVGTLLWTLWIGLINQKVCTRLTPSYFRYHLHNYVFYKSWLQSQITMTSLLQRYKVTAIILDIANYRLLKPVRSDVPVDPPKYFRKIKFMNKAADNIILPALSNLDITNYFSNPQSCQSETYKFCCKTPWPYHNWRFNGHREGEAERASLQRSQTPRANNISWNATEKMLFESIDKCFLNPLIFTLNGGLNGNK